MITNSQGFRNFFEDNPSLIPKLKDFIFAVSPSLKNSTSFDFFNDKSNFNNPNNENTDETTTKVNQEVKSNLDNKVSPNNTNDSTNTTNNQLDNNIGNVGTLTNGSNLAKPKLSFSINLPNNKKKKDEENQE